jgi:hypothetical protein
MTRVSFGAQRQSKLGSAAEVPPVFCPNCGTQNEEGASPCKKCGFKLSGVSAPKFKGTMMLSSDHSVQQLVEEHRRKLEEQAAIAVDVPPSNLDPDLANSKPGLNTIRGGLQPVRPGLSRPKPGGTVIGVAPQVGGFTPAAPGAASAAAARAAAHESAPAPSSGERRLAPAAESPWLAAVAPALDATAGRVAPSATSESAQAASALAEPASALRASTAGSGPTLESAAPPRLADAGAAQPPVTGDVAAAHSPARGATEKPEASLLPGPDSTSRDPRLPAPARVRPLEVFLILITFGLYGLVLLFRQRGQQP